MRTPARITAGVGGTFIGWFAWNFTLHATHTETFNTDAPLIALSWQDAGSGILTFVAVALILGLWIDRATPAATVVAMNGVAAIVAAIFDVFVL